MSSKRRVARDPNAPKRNLSPYLLYQNAMRNTFKMQNPGMTFGQLSKYTSAMYAEMPPDEKDAWNLRAEQDKQRYLHELSLYVPPAGYDVKGDAIVGHSPAMKVAMKQGKNARDPNAPKKNMSAYLMYQNTMRESFRAENPGMTFGQLSKFTSAMYKSLTPEEKSRWEDAALQDKVRYETEMSSYQPPPGFDPTGVLMDAGVISGTRKYKKKNKDPNAPKRARGSYVFFTLEERPKIMKDTPEMKFTNVGHAMGERWRALSPEDKKKYEDLAAEDKKRFDREMAEYQASRPQLDAPQRGGAQGGEYAHPHPQYQEAQQYAEQYYAQQDPNAAAYAQYYAQNYATGEHYA